MSKLLCLKVGLLKILIEKKPYKLLLSLGVPVFIEEPSSSYHYINRADGHFITLPCRAFGQPEPTIRWYRSGIEEIDVASANSSFIVSGGSLLIPVGKQVQSEVSTYHCTASNNLGTIRSASTVIRPAFIDAFRNSRLDAYPLTSRGGGTRLDCQAPAHYPSEFRLITIVVLFVNFIKTTKMHKVFKKNTEYDCMIGLQLFICLPHS